ncbi:transferase hexapeptide (six repeat-containing protein) [Actinoplanes cyaneus]|nr:transferase hexapeptide (six repeat-containing protein) [Actinoplanes cyaneus]
MTQTILDTIRELRPHLPMITVSSTLTELGLDSLDRLLVATAVEASTGACITDAALTAAMTIADLAHAATSTTAAPPPPPTMLGIIDPDAVVGAGTRLWHQAQVAAGAVVGADCTLGKNAYVGSGSRIGDRVKIGNGANLFGVIVDDDAMISPMVGCFEDPAPRATVDGRRKNAGEFTARPVRVGRHASVGGGALLAPGVSIGADAMVAVGAVVHRDVPAHALVAGNPARQCGWVCTCGWTLNADLACPGCGRTYRPDQDTIVPAAGSGDR